MEFTKVGSTQMALLVISTIIFIVVPLAIVIHTAIDAVAGLSMTGVVDLPIYVIEIILGVFGIATFCGGYFLLYKKDINDGNVD